MVPAKVDSVQLLPVIGRLIDGLVFNKAPPKVTTLGPLHVPKAVIVVATPEVAPTHTSTFVVVGGAGCTVNIVGLSPKASALLTLIFPVFARAGTVAVICVALFTVKTVAGTPPKETPVTPVKLVPVITTTVPTVPQELLFGVKLVIVGTVTQEMVAVQPE